MEQVSEKDLRHQLEDLRERYPKLKDDALFVAWFVVCFITGSEPEGVDSLVGGSGDKSLDALVIDDSARRVFLVQGKYRQKLDSGNEKRSDVMTFAQLANSLTNSEEFETYRQGLASSAVVKVEEARKKIERKGYRLQLYYVTTGKVSEGLFEEAQRMVRLSPGGGSLEVFDGKKVMRLLADYLDGVAPPVPLLEFELENGSGIITSSVLQRYDQEIGISSWVVPVAVTQVADLFESVGVRLFARNVRGYLGNTEINDKLKSTLEHEPGLFWYFNNGITIVCDSAEKVSRDGRELLRLQNPQVINGQQTTRTLHAHARSGIGASVMVRVIAVPRRTEEESRRFENLVSKIVGATNSQNKISESDLMSNDRQQILLERNLRKLGYQYLRKRQAKGEAKRLGGGVSRFQINKEELAQVSAACQMDPAQLRLGKEHLFGEAVYTTVFPTADADYYLGRYWLSVQVKLAARGIPERAYMKWLVIHWVWARLAPTLNRRSRREAFRTLAEKRGLEAFPKAIEAVFRMVSAYFRENRGSGDAKQDPAGFFRLKGHHRQFERFWQASTMGHVVAFNRAWQGFEEELEALENS